MAAYDKANEILDRAFPARAKANAIMSRSFPAMARGDRVLADSGIAPRGGRGSLQPGTAGGIWTPAAGGRAGDERGGGTQAPDAPGVYTGPRTARGPLYVGPGRFTGRIAVPGASPAATLIAEDAARAVARGIPAVDIRVWAAKLGEAGVASDDIYAAYENAGGDASLSAQQQRGDTSSFLTYFVGGLEQLGVSPEVIVGAYQEAGGRIGG